VSAVPGPGRSPDDFAQRTDSPPARLPRDASPVDKIRRAVALRNEWLAFGLSTEPADRPAAEAAVTQLYHLAGAPPPAFTWVASPLAGLRAVRDATGHYPVIPPAQELVTQPMGQWPAAARLASRRASLRGRLDARIRRPAPGWTAEARFDGGSAGLYSPEDAVLSGIGYRDVVVVTAGESLHQTLADAVGAPLRAALAEAADAAGVASVLKAVVGFRGQHDASWVGYYDSRRRSRFGGYPPADTGELEAWAALARSAGWWWPGDGLCVIAERPTAVHTEPLAGAYHGERRLHCADGPAIAFGDGFGVNVLHGTPVPGWVLSAPTVGRIRSEQNIEVRRSAIERLGWGAYIREAGMTLVATSPDPGNPGAELRLYDDAPVRGWGAPDRVLVVTNGTPEPDGHRRQYGINVPGGLNRPVDAVAWTYGLTGDQYAILVRRT
jgi:hypothetical protein